MEHFSTTKQFATKLRLKRTASAGMMVAALLCSATTADGNLILNGDFSADDVGLNANKDIAGFWQATPSNWTDGGQDTTNTLPNPAQNFLELFDGEGTGFGGDWEHPIGGDGDTSVDLNDRKLQQTVGGLTPGEAYDLSFQFLNIWKSSFSPQVSGEGIAEVFDDAATTMLLGSDMSGVLSNQQWADGLVTFLAPADGNVTVQFRVLSVDQQGSGITLDNVHLAQVPEPGTYLTLGSLLGLGLAAARGRAFV